MRKIVQRIHGFDEEETGLAPVFTTAPVCVLLRAETPSHRNKKVVKSMMRRNSKNTERKRNLPPV
jgi:hypothetical protein